MNIIYIHSC